MATTVVLASTTQVVLTDTTSVLLVRGVTTGGGRRVAPAQPKPIVVEAPKPGPRRFVSTSTWDVFVLQSTASTVAVDVSSALTARAAWVTDALAHPEDRRGRRILQSRSEGQHHLRTSTAERFIERAYQSDDEVAAVLLIELLKG